MYNEQVAIRQLFSVILTEFFDGVSGSKEFFYSFRNKFSEILGIFIWKPKTRFLLNRPNGFCDTENWI